MHFIIQKFRMGNRNPRIIFNKKQYLQLEFYMEVHDRNLGSVKIYTCRSKPLLFIAKYQSEIHDSKIFNTFKQIANQNELPLLELYGFNIQSITCCNTIIRNSITLYWEYHCFYLCDYLEKRAKFNCYFIDSEVWHIIEVLCVSYMTFRKYQIDYDLDPAKFVITPEGKLKCFWSHLRSDSKHIKFVQYLSDSRAGVSQFLYSPEQMQNIHRNRSTAPKINFDKCNSFRLGMIILQCLTLREPCRCCYDPSMTKINFKSVRRMIQMCISPKFKSDIVEMVKNLLDHCPDKRMSPQQVYENYKNNFNPQYQLKVCSDYTLGKQIYKQQNMQPEMDTSDQKTTKLSPYYTKI